MSTGQTVEHSEHQEFSNDEHQEDASTEPRDASGDEPHEISNDECFHILSNHRRRYTLHYLNQSENPVTIGELSDQIAAWENGIETDDVSHDERKRVYTSLQQVHLPRMDEDDVIAFDDRKGVVEKGPTAESLDVYLEVVGRRELPWSQLYLGLAVLNGALIGTASLGTVQFPTDIALAAFAVTTFLITSIAHIYYTRTEMKLRENGTPPAVEYSERENGGKPPGV